MTQQPQPETQQAFPKIQGVPVTDPDAADALDAFLDEMKAIADALPEDEPAANTDE